MWAVRVAHISERTFDIIVCNANLGSVKDNVSVNSDCPGREKFLSVGIFSAAIYESTFFIKIPRGAEIVEKLPGCGDFYSSTYGTPMVKRTNVGSLQNDAKFFSVILHVGEIAMFDNVTQITYDFTSIRWWWNILIVSNYNDIRRNDIDSIE